VIFFREHFRKMVILNVFSEFPSRLIDFRFSAVHLSVSGVCSVCRMYSICRWNFVVVRGQLSSVGCRVLKVDCRVSLSMFVVRSWLSGDGCQVLAVDCRT
jgi:hypothetical protein